MIFPKFDTGFVPPAYSLAKPKTQHYKSDNFIYHREPHYFTSLCEDQWKEGLGAKKKTYFSRHDWFAFIL